MPCRYQYLFCFRTLGHVFDGLVLHVFFGTFVIAKSKFFFALSIFGHYYKVCYASIGYSARCCRISATAPALFCQNSCLRPLLWADIYIGRRCALFLLNNNRRRAYLRAKSLCFDPPSCHRPGRSFIGFKSVGYLMLIGVPTFMKRCCHCLKRVITLYERRVYRNTFAAWMIFPVG